MVAGAAAAPLSAGATGLSSGIPLLSGGSTGAPGFVVSVSHPQASKHCTWASCGQTCSGQTGNICCS